MLGAKKQKQWKVVFNGDRGDDYEQHYDAYDAFTCALQEVISEKEWKKQLDNDPWAWKDEKFLFGCSLVDEQSCCGFPVLCEFSSTKDAIPHADEIAKELKKWMTAKGEEVLKKKGYQCAYLPDQKVYDGARAVLQAAGFMPGVKLKSNHGNYTNTRWEWFDEKKVTKPKYEAHLSTLPF